MVHARKLTWAAAAVAALMCCVVVGVMLARRRRGEREEHFQAAMSTPDAYAAIASSFKSRTQAAPTQADLDEVARALRGGGGSSSPAEVDEKVDAVLKQKAAAEAKTIAVNTSDQVRLGEATWTWSTRLGMSTVDVPFSLFAPRGEAGTLGISIRAAQPGAATDRSTMFASVTVGGTEAMAKHLEVGPDKNEVAAVAPDASGSLAFTQTEGQTPFIVSLTYRGETTMKRVDPPAPGFPADEAASPAVEAGPPSRSGTIVTVPFTLKKVVPGEKVRFWLRAPPRSTYFGQLVLEGTMGGVDGANGEKPVAAGPYVHEAGLAPKDAGLAVAGRVTFEQAPGSGPEITVWVTHGGEARAVRVPAAPVLKEAPNGNQNPVPNKKEIIHGVPEPVQSQAIEANARLTFDNPTARLVAGTNYSISVPFVIKVPDSPPGSALRVSWELDPTATQFREVRVGGKAWMPDTALGGSGGFETVLPPSTQPEQSGVAVFDQPLGRRPFRVNLEFAGERASLRVAGDPPEPKSTGFIGDLRRPEERAGEPDIRFLDMHETAERRVGSVFENLAGKEPDEATKQFLVGKYLESGGDMKKLNNLASTISTMVSTAADGGSAETASVQAAVAALQAGATPGEAKESLRDWKEYETYRAMWRPDVNAGGAGESALKRPWSEEAKTLSEGLRSDVRAVPISTFGQVSSGP